MFLSFRQPAPVHAKKSAPLACKVHSLDTLGNTQKLEGGGGRDFQSLQITSLLAMELEIIKRSWLPQPQKIERAMAVLGSSSYFILRVGVANPLLTNTWTYNSPGAYAGPGVTPGS